MTLFSFTSYSHESNEINDQLLFLEPLSIFVLTSIGFILKSRKDRCARETENNKDSKEDNEDDGNRYIAELESRPSPTAKKTIIILIPEI